MLAEKGTDIKMKTAEEMLQFAQKSQKAEFIQYRRAFEKIAENLREDEYAVFSMVGETYIINEGIGMSYPALAVTDSRVLIGGETIRGRLLTRYIMDAYERDEILSVKMMNRKLLIKTSNAEIRLEGRNLDTVAEKFQEALE